MPLDEQRADLSLSLSVTLLIKAGNVYNLSSLAPRLCSVSSCDVCFSVSMFFPCLCCWPFLSPQFSLCAGNTSLTITVSLSLSLSHMRFIASERCVMSAQACLLPLLMWRFEGCDYPFPWLQMNQEEGFTPFVSSSMKTSLTYAFAHLCLQCFV